MTHYGASYDVTSHDVILPLRNLPRARVNECYLPLVNKMAYFDTLNAEEKRIYAAELMFICGEDPFEQPRHRLSSNPDTFPDLEQIGIVDYFINGVSFYTHERFLAYKVQSLTSGSSTDSFEKSALSPLMVAQTQMLLQR